MSELRGTYNKIATTFSQTRQWPWLDFNLILPYLKEGDFLLDLGCGNGRLKGYLQKHIKIKYQGLDISDNLLAEAKKQFPEQAFQRGDMAEKFPWEKLEFDHIWSIAAWHHLKTKQERLASLKECYRVMKPRGFLVIMVWNLWQPKYWRYFIKGIWQYLNGQNESWKDLYIPWRKGQKKTVWRYYHAFSKLELKKILIKDNWKIIDHFYCRKGQKMGWRHGYNLCFICQKNT